MSGKSGMKRGVVSTCLRQKMWQSMRIMKRFNLPDLLRTVSQATESNARMFILRLESAGYIGRIGGYVSGRAGQYKSYALLKDTGPIMPVLSSKNSTTKDFSTSEHGGKA